MISAGILITSALCKRFFEGIKASYVGPRCLQKLDKEISVDSAALADHKFLARFIKSHKKFAVMHGKLYNVSLMVALSW